MLFGRGVRVLKHCPNGHAMEMAWRECPRCSGRRPRAEVVGREVTDATIMLERPTRPDPEIAAIAAPDWVALLTATSGPHAGRDFAILPGRWVFGRSPAGGGEVRAEAIPDPGLSREHFALEAGVAAVILRDLGSTNGTFVGDVKIERQILRDGDRIRAGESVFTVRLSLKAGAS